MDLTYKVTREDYLELMMHHMNSIKKGRYKWIRSIVVNAVFLLMAVYLYMNTGHLSMVTRIMPIIMSIGLMVISIHKRSRKKDPASELDQLIETGILDQSYFGEHRLSINSGLAMLCYGKTEIEMDCKEIYNIEKYENITILFAQNRIFEIIPNAALDKGNNRLKMSSEIEDNHLALELENRIRSRQD